MTATVTICGLGPGGPGRLTEATRESLATTGPRFVRTTRHPTADLIDGAVSFDDVYETASSFDEVYRTIADTVLASAREHGRALYAVPGSPLVLERSVRWIREAASEAADVDVELLPAVSFLDEVWARLGVDPVDEGVRLIDGLSFVAQAAGERGPLLVAHTYAQWVLSDIKLALEAGPEQRAVVLQGLGTADERIVEVGWPEFDRAVEADHLTSVYLPEVSAPVAAELMRSVELMHRLRSECPWDRAQDHASLRPFLVEEAYEVLDALDEVVRDTDRPAGHDGPTGAADPYASLEEELGDLWFQILFHAELAAEAGAFTIADVAAGLTDKMIRRHPHVYGPTGRAGPIDQAAPDAAAPDGAAPDGIALDGTAPDGAAPDGAVSGGERALGPADWERLKQQEKRRRSVLDGIPSALPALAKAQKTLRKAAGAGHPADPTALRRALHEAADLGPGVAGTDGDGGPDDATVATIGTALMAIADLARRLDVDAESALRLATDRAGARFRVIESGTRTDADSGPGAERTDADSGTDGSGGAALAVEGTNWVVG